MGQHWQSNYLRIISAPDEPIVPLGGIRMANVSRILIADDHGVFLDGLKQVISRTTDMTVAAEATDGPDVLQKIRDNGYDLLVLDISLPGRSGLDIMTEIKRIRPELPVLILSMHPEEQYAVHAFKSGAAGYLTKGSSSQELVEAMQAIVSGKKYASASMGKLLAGAHGCDVDAPLRHERLSPREYQVMLMIAAGATPKRIAEELMVGMKTVNTYRVRILQKMELKCSSDLNRYARQHKLVQRPGTL